MANSREQQLLGRLTQLKIASAFGSNTNSEHLLHLHKHFTSREIEELRNLAAIPKDYKIPSSNN